MQRKQTTRGRVEMCWGDRNPLDYGWQIPTLSYVFLYFFCQLPTWHPCQVTYRRSWSIWSPAIRRNGFWPELGIEAAQRFCWRLRLFATLDPDIPVPAQAHIQARDAAAMHDMVQLRFRFGVLFTFVAPAWALPCLSTARDHADIIMLMVLDPNHNS
jgi:hypothetical protein